MLMPFFSLTNIIKKPPNDIFRSKSDGIVPSIPIKSGGHYSPPNSIITVSKTSLNRQT
jgi:hypothetical protein